MIAQVRAATNPRRRLAWTAAAAISLWVLTPSCGQDGTGVDPGDRLCNGEAGLGVSIGGRAQPLEFCADDGDVSVLLTALDRYDVAAQASTSEGVFQVRMVFAVRPDFPVSLVPVESLSETTGDPGKVWILYEEVPDGSDAIESRAVSGGSFRLSFSDENVLAGVFEGITLTMHDVSSGSVVGTRKLLDGFFSLTVKSPATVAGR